jgi:hypothetical protein
MKNLANRMPEYNVAGCLISVSGKNKWQFLQELLVGEYLDLADEECRNNAYPLARRAGIKISISTLANGDYRILRVA